MSASAPTSPPSTNNSSRAPPPTATPPPSNRTSPPPSSPAAPPPSSPAAPPPSTPASPPPSTPASQPPSSSSAPPPATPAAQAPSASSNSSAPPSGTPSSPILPPSPPSSNFSTPPPPSTPNASAPASSTTRSPPPPASPRNPSPPSSRPPPPPPPPVASDSSSSSLSSGAVVGIAIAGIAVLMIMFLLLLCCKRKRRRSDGSSYHDYPPARKDDGYQVRWHQNGPPSGQVGGRVPKPTPPSSLYGVSAQHPHRMSSGGSEYPAYDGHLPPPSPGMPLGFSNSTYTFSYDDLDRATNGFSKANLLGQGGFGYVHKGLLSDGREVAIKQLKAGSGQGDREFQAEIEIISRVHHRHLVSLVGYCITGSQRLLVYEFVPNNTLEFHLHVNQQTMKWDTRHKIALGSAKGLAYLHEDCNPKIIHRDIKAANILLDFKFEAKVADFGLAKFTSDANTHVSTRVMGTFGYLAPEYASSGKLSEKSDVFSFGVMLLELITGRRPVDTSQTFFEDSLVDWARPLLEHFVLHKGDPQLVDPQLIDQKLQDDYDCHEMSKMVTCAVVCTQHSAKKRPSMSQVVRALEGDGSMSDFEQATRLGHRFPSSHGSSDYDTTQYNADMIKFRKMALGSQEYAASSEYSAPTSEYGLFGTGSSSEEAQTREMEARNMRKHAPSSSGRPEF